MCNKNPLRMKVHDQKQTLDFSYDDKSFFMLSTAFAYLWCFLCICIYVEIGRDTGANHSEVHWRENDVVLSWISGRTASAESRLPTSPYCHGKHQHMFKH